MMSAPRAFLIAAALLVGVATFLYWRREREARAAASAQPMASAEPAASARPVGSAPKVATGAGEAPSEIAAALNAPGGDIRNDLEIASELFVAWQSNFPRTGNPVGENFEITAALAGKNELGFAFIPRNHRAINARGELCDRWGTPFRLHQLSGTQMEIRSAGPDRQFATPDDAQWPE